MSAAQPSPSYSPGLDGVVAGETTICQVDPNAGLLYRGYDVDELAPHVPFEDVVWLLLCRLQPSDVLRLYMSDKDRFFTQYQTWSTCKREWAVDLIKTRYLAPAATGGPGS